jgi:hypothetical protein
MMGERHLSCLDKSTGRVLGGKCGGGEMMRSC